MKASEKILFDTLQHFQFQTEGNHVDLRQLPNDEVFRFFESLEKTKAFVFHGTNADKKFEMLMPHQTNDASKESGNKNAIYADQTALVPMAVAVLNRPYLQSKFKSFVTGWDMKHGQTIFKFSRNIYKLFTNGDKRLFSDGYVYVLGKSDFVNGDDAGGEWHSERARKPLFAVRISANLGPAIYIMEPGKRKTVYEYLPEEEQRIFDFTHKKRES